MSKTCLSSRPNNKKCLMSANLWVKPLNRRNFAAWSRQVADDCLFSDDDGILQTKARLMEHLMKLPTAYDHRVDPRDYVVHLYGDTAVVTSRVTDHEQFTDSDIISEMRRTETYVKQNGSWLLIARQWGMLPVNFRKPVAVDPRTYNGYIGQYEWRPGLVDTVVVKDGKLWSQLGEDEGEYLPLGSDTFVVKDDLGSVTFSRDARGHVTDYIYHRVDGQKSMPRKSNEQPRRYLLTLLRNSHSTNGLIRQ
jgi:ketosteroid isomerase-like protein